MVTARETGGAFLDAGAPGGVVGGFVDGVDRPALVVGWDGGWCLLGLGGREGGVYCACFHLNVRDVG